MDVNKFEIDESFMNGYVVGCVILISWALFVIVVRII